MQRFDDDSDMKIAGVHFSERNEATDDSICIGKDLEYQKKTGNLEKARRIGFDLAYLMSGNKEVALAGLSGAENEEMTAQRYILLGFTVIHVIEQRLSNPILSQTAKNAFYECLKINSRELYNNIADSGEISFYYLCARTSEEDSALADGIGVAFAKVCNKAGDIMYEELGKFLFIRYGEEVDKKISEHL